MDNKVITAFWLGCLVLASTGEPLPATAAPALPELPDFDVAKGSFTYSDGMDFDNIGGDLSVTEFDFLSLLSRPITVAGDLMLVPMLQYGFTELEFDGVAPAFPIGDEGLHSLSLHLAAVKLNRGSPWFYGAWTRAELASDFQHIDGDDFTFDIAGGAGYRVNESLTLAAGLAVLNLNGDVWVVPGINFDWVVNEKVRIGLYGPRFRASYTLNEDWNFSLRGAPSGGIWNITDNLGNSKSIDLSSYQVGAFASRRLTDNLWLNAGAGMTFFNNVSYGDPDGDNQFLDQDLDSGLFGQIGVSLKAW